MGFKKKYLYFNWNINYKHNIKTILFFCNVKKCFYDGNLIKRRN